MTATATTPPDPSVIDTHHQGDTLTVTFDDTTITGTLTRTGRYAALRYTTPTRTVWRTIRHHTGTLARSVRHITTPTGDPHP